jgi:YfiH family protein
VTSGWTWHERDGVGYWRVEALEAAAGCLAAFSSRSGGVSSGPHATLNLGGRGDRPDNVAENRRRFARAARFDPALLATARQVHGDRVAEVVAPGSAGEADALWTRVTGPVLTVFVADCVPVFLADPVGRAAALVHAGWRGSAAGVTRRALDALLRAGADPARIVAAIGPSAGPCCYEVDEPVMARFSREVLRPARAGHARLDLWQENRRQLVAAGVPPDRVHVAGICTICRPDLLFSHRGAGGGPTGHMAAVLQLR